jgi:uncharacterized membrane protein
MSFSRRMKGKVTVGWIMAVLLGVVMIGSLIPTIGDLTYGARYGGNATDPTATNVTGAASTLLGLVVLIITIIFVFKLAKVRQ